MIPIPGEIFSQLEILVGNPAQISANSEAILHPDRLAFLSDLSNHLRHHPAAQDYPDLMAFSFWCRSNKLRSLTHSPQYQHCLRFGLGLLFHICPANVPINFAYSLAFGLLAGNSSVVKLSQTRTPQTEILLDCITELLSQPKHHSIQTALLLLQYGHHDATTAFWFSQADARIIWGGDHTVNHMRQFATPPHSREIAFHDRYSLCVINAEKILEIDEDELTKRARQFYNDIYIMDQAACSSPQSLVWIGKRDTIAEAQSRFWPKIARKASEHYTPSPIDVMNKFVDLCNITLTHPELESVVTYGNTLYRVQQKRLLPEQDRFRGYQGTLYEMSLTHLNPLSQVINTTYQTLTYFGFSHQEMEAFVLNNSLRGLDRIVPIGQALDMSIFWDGYDVISSLSRIVDLQSPSENITPVKTISQESRHHV